MYNTKQTLPHILCIQGNIGVGKSTLMDKLRDGGFYTVGEPLKEYMNDNMGRVWQDRKRWAMAFNLEMIEWYQRMYRHDFDRMSALNDYETNLDMDIKYQPNHGQNQTSTEHASDLVIVERSALSNREVFVKGFVEDEAISHWEYTLYNRIFDLISWKPKYIIYLRCDPKMSFQRVVKRTRERGKDTSKKDQKYQEMVQIFHERLEKLYHKESKLLGKDQELIIVDVTNKDADTVFKEVCSHLDELKSRATNIADIDENVPLKSRVPDVTNVDDKEQSQNVNWISCLCCRCMCECCYSQNQI